MGKGRNDKKTAFIVTSEDESKEAVGLLRGRGWIVHSGEGVNQAAALMIPTRSKRILLGHGSAREFSIAYGASKKKRRWLWVGMKNPPKGARIYLYSCYTGIRLASFLSERTAFGHFGPVPIPMEGIKEVVLPYLESVHGLMDCDGDDPLMGWLDELQGKASQLLRERGRLGGAEFEAALWLSKSLYPPRDDSK